MQYSTLACHINAHSPPLLVFFVVAIIPSPVNFLGGICMQILKLIICYKSSGPTTLINIAEVRRTIRIHRAIEQCVL